MSGISKSNVKTSNNIYLNKDEVNVFNYSNDIIELINNTEFEKYKFCNCCGKYYPFHSNFFMREKRQKDGYENKCRLCRNGKFIGYSDGVKMFNLNENESIINNYINFLNSDAVKISDNKFLKDNAKEILDYLIENMSDDEVYSISRDWIKSKKLYGLSIHSYNGSITDMFYKLYGDNYKPWLFSCVSKGYWEDEHNRKYAFNWFLDKLIDSNIIESENYLNMIPLAKLMSEHKLSGLFNYFGSVYNVLDYYYPNRFKDYEMNILTDISKDTVKDCLRNYILNKLSLSINEIKYYISFNEIISAKDKQVIKVYRNAMLNGLFHNFNDMIEYCFNELDIEEYKQCNHKNYYKCYDGNIAKSSEERQLYYILKDNGLNVEICSEYNKKYLIYDKINNNKMYADFWIYEDDKIIIVEYYGYFNNSGTFADDIGYSDRHDKKVDYYTNRLDTSKFSYIGIYPTDLKKYNSSGLIRKFKDIGINLTV